MAFVCFDDYIKENIKDFQNEKYDNLEMFVEFFSNTFLQNYILSLPEKRKRKYEFLYKRAEDDVVIKIIPIDFSCEYRNTLMNKIIRWAKTIDTDDIDIASDIKWESFMKLINLYTRKTGILIRLDAELPFNQLRKEYNKKCFHNTGVMKYDLRCDTKIYSEMYSFKYDNFVSYDTAECKDNFDEMVQYKCINIISDKSKFCVNDIGLPNIVQTNYNPAFSHSDSIFNKNDRFCVSSVACRYTNKANLSEKDIANTWCKTKFVKDNIICDGIKSPSPSYYAFSINGNIYIGTFVGEGNSKYYFGDRIYVVHDHYLLNLFVPVWPQCNYFTMLYRLSNRQYLMKRDHIPFIYFDDIDSIYFKKIEFNNYIFSMKEQMCNRYNTIKNAFRDSEIRLIKMQNNISDTLIHSYSIYPAKAIKNGESYEWGPLWKPIDKEITDHLEIIQGNIKWDDKCILAISDPIDIQKL